MKPALFALAIALALLPAVSGRARQQLEPFEAIGIDARPGAAVPLDVAFRDEAGRTVRLGDYVGRRPVVLAPVYYRCPNVCGVTLAHLFNDLDMVPLRPDRDFAVVAISIDPRERPADAAAAKAEALRRYHKAGAPAGLYFLTGSTESIAAVMDAIGYRYRWDPALRQYAHAAAVAVLTPRGRVSRWLYGFGYGPTDLRLALVEAGQGRVGSVVDQILLLCYHYDPATGQYSGLVWTLLRVGGTLAAVVLAGFVGLSVWRERRTRRALGRPEGPVA